MPARVTSLKIIIQVVPSLRSSSPARVCKACMTLFRIGSFSNARPKESIPQEVRGVLKTGELSKNVRLEV